MRARIERKLRESGTDWRVLNTGELQYLLDNAQLSTDTKDRIQEFMNPSLWLLTQDDIARVNPGDLPAGLEYKHGRVRATSAEGRRLLAERAAGLPNPGPGKCLLCRKEKTKVTTQFSELQRGGALYAQERQGIVCYPCVQKQLKANHCPYCGHGLTRRVGMRVCLPCERGFRDGKSNPGNGLSSSGQKKAEAVYIDFSMQDPKKGWEKSSISLPDADNPLVWLAPMAEIVYISDKEGDVPNVQRNGGITDGQHYVHTLKPPYPDILMTADRKTLIIPLQWKENGRTKTASLRVEDGWMREHDE